MTLTERTWTLEPASKVLPDAAVENMVRYMGMCLTPELLSKVLDAMAGDWSYINNKGKLSTRFGKAVHDAGVDKKSEAYLVDVLGGEVSANYYPAIFWCVTRKLDWSHGEYGDRNTCFFSYLSHHRATVVAAGGGAMLMRRAVFPQAGDPVMTEGIARAWLIPTAYGLGITNNYGVQLTRFRDILLNEMGPEYVAVKAQISAHACHVNRDYDIITHRNGPGYILAKPEHQGVIESQATVVTNVEGCRCTVKRREGMTTNMKDYKRLRVCDHCPFGETKDHPVQAELFSA